MLRGAPSRPPAASLAKILDVPSADSYGRRRIFSQQRQRTLERLKISVEAIRERELEDASEGGLRKFGRVHVQMQDCQLGAETFNRPALDQGSQGCGPGRFDQCSSPAGYAD